MNVTIIDAETRAFNGKTYTRFGKYFRRARAFLHRDVWQFSNGPILPGHHIHHIDHDRDNNDLSNLEMVEGREHLSRHHKGRKFYPATAIAAYAVWRQTDEGKAFQSEMGKRNAHFMHVVREFACGQCGVAFSCEDRGNNRFCSNACKSKWRRAAGLDDIDKVCAVCGAAYRTSRFHKSTTCSRKCRGVISGAKRAGVPQPKRKQPDNSWVV